MHLDDRAVESQGLDPIRMISSSCKAVKTRSNTPAFAQRFIRVYTVCHRPNRLGRLRHLHPFSATYKIPFSTSRFEMVTFPRCLGKQPSIRRNCSSVIVMQQYNRNCG